MPSIRTVPLLVLLATLPGCGGGYGGSSSTPTSPSGPQSGTFNGTATTNDTGGCSSSGHAISAGTGTITVQVDVSARPV